MKGAANAHDCSGKQPRVAHAGQFGLVRQSSLRAVIHVGGHCCKGGSCGLADGVWTDDSSRLLQQLLPRLLPRPVTARVRGVGCRRNQRQLRAAAASCRRDQDANGCTDNRSDGREALSRAPPDSSAAVAQHANVGCRLDECQREGLQNVKSGGDGGWGCSGWGRGCD